jgi:hypothetical protein
MNNIKQITPFSEEIDSAPIETIQVYIGNKEYVSKEYYVISLQLLTGGSIGLNKIGYVCEPKGLDYPIVIKTGGTARIIYLGKSGMFEAMEETFLDVNAKEEDPDVEELDCLPEITEVKVPKDIQFTLDYSYPVY